MLAEVERLQIGAPEGSLDSFVRRYGAFKWTPETRADIGPRENWLDQWQYKHRLNTLNDYAYFAEVNPWSFPTLADVYERDHHCGDDKASSPGTQSHATSVKLDTGRRFLAHS
jgi:hypothetical protein